MIDASERLAQALNWLTLATLVLVAVVVPALVLRDARRRGASYAQALGWALLTLVLLPIGAGLYLLLGRSSNSGRRA